MDPDWYWLLLLLLVPVLVLIRILRSAWFKGKLGEFKVNFGTSLLLSPKTYRPIKNVTFPIRDGTLQIDHLIISPYGVFVIETKNMSGWIFGQPHETQWTQVIFDFRQKFQNPLVQNKAHVKAVQALLDLEPDQIHNVVVFVGDSTFMTPMPDEVVHGVGELVKFIRAKRAPVFSEDEVNYFVRQVLSKRLEPGSRTERFHIQNVERRLSETPGNRRTACPRCGGIMVDRVNRHTGDRFLGCARFPKCKGTRSLSVN